MKTVRPKKYLIKQDRDEFVIEIPENWKVTFASVNPASNGPLGRDGYCVRVYEMPGSKLRAVFDSARSLRDLSIPLARKVKSEVGTASWNKDSQGNFSETTDVKVDARLVLDSGEAF